MKLLYKTGIFFYSLFIKLASLFNKKAKLRTSGVKKTFEILKNFNSEKTIWFHCASLGEFEQGRPLIEKIKQKYPEYKIALSFFSPSGYEIRKNFELADTVFYLPDDTRKNAEKIISALKPDYVFFVKYEFWYFYINTLKNKNIPLYLVSGIFRENQIFFKPYGNFFLKILKNFSVLFVQNQKSFNLLTEAGLENIKISGDTRFDRVLENSKNRKKIPLAEKFAKNSLLIVAGSTWKPDEDILLEFAGKTNTKIIIAPHEIKKENINGIIKKSPVKTLKYSEANEKNIKNADILIINNIGMLSSLYAYADIAYIGGGFGKGIHNTLEAAVFGIPVIFGPEYEKFDEAKELIKRKAGFSISGYNELEKILNSLINDSDLREKSGKRAEKYVKENTGACNKILSEIKFR